MNRNEFADLLTRELSEDHDDKRLNRILEAADRYAATEKQAAVKRIQSYLESYCDDCEYRDDCDSDCSGCQVCFVDVESLFEHEEEDPDERADR